MFYACKLHKTDSSIDDLINLKFDHNQEEVNITELNNNEFDTCIVKKDKNYRLNLYANKTPGGASSNNCILKVFKNENLIYTSLFLSPYSHPKFEILNTNPLLISCDETYNWGTGILEKQRCFLINNSITNNLETICFLSHSTSQNMCDYFVKVELNEIHLKNNLFTLDYIFELNDSINKTQIKKSFEFDLITRRFLFDQNDFDSLLLSKTYILPCDETSFKNFKNRLK
jgi:hypothetical protein